MSKIDKSLKTYIDLYGLMQLESSRREDHRQFGLTHESLLKRPVTLLSRWVDEHRHLLGRPLLSDRLLGVVYSATVILLVIAFFLGIFAGIGLLRYSGEEPVNLLYFLAAVFLLPLVTMTMTLLAMLRANRSESLLVNISPAYWMERILLLLPAKNREMMEDIQINPLIGNHIVIRRSQELALTFSIGLFFALIGVVASEDIAFGWSTTLQITPEEFHSFLSWVALPWRDYLPGALPSLELIEKSHYFRLGGELSREMISSATLLGEWWKFLAMTTLCYALLLRWFIFLLASRALRHAIERATLSMDGVRDMLREMQEPLITTEATVPEPLFEESDDLDIVIDGSMKEHYDSVIGWALDREMIVIFNELNGIDVGVIYEAGGLNTLDDDQKVIDALDGDILFYLKAWEPPTMDFIDFLTALSEDESRSVTLYPVGTTEQGYRVKDDAFDIWAEKVDKLKSANIRMKR
ncbi:MAG: DUF2868 domain-containing protein [Campylobacterota bacterium]|nr:DUF2868 domain-containing protein [Campylobacterota bacterium]